MHGKALFLAGLLAGGTLAAPTAGPAAAKKHHFKIPVKGSKAHGLPPHREMYKVFAKYGWLEQGYSPFPDSDGPVPSAKAAVKKPATHFFAAGNSTDAPTATGTPQPTSSTSSKSSAGSAEVTSIPEQYNSEYLTPVSVGGQELNLNFDTGSADLWVFSSSLPASQQGQHSIYQPSSNYKSLTNGTWSISYGDGSSASGIVGCDSVAVGAATVTEQAIELATSVSQQFLQDTNSDGLLGLAFSSINRVKVNNKAQPQRTFFENLMGSLDKPVFSVDLNEDDGTYEFGAIDESKYSGDLSYVDIDSSNGFWQFPSTQYSINGTAAPNTAASPAIADTGTSLILTDILVARAYYAQVAGARLSRAYGGYIYPCASTLPDFGLQIGDAMVTLDGAGLGYAAVDATNVTCFGGIQSNSGAGYQIFGDVMLRQTYAVFDGGNSRFGVAQKN